MVSADLIFEGILSVVNNDPTHPPPWYHIPVARDGLHNQQSWSCDSHMTRTHLLEREEQERMGTVSDREDNMWNSDPGNV